MRLPYIRSRTCGLIDVANAQLLSINGNQELRLGGPRIFFHVKGRQNTVDSAGTGASTNCVNRTIGKFVVYLHRANEVVIDWGIAFK